MKHSTVLSIVGARPQFIKAAMVSRALAAAAIPEIVVHTGQHYDANMSEVFFRDFAMAEPKYNLEVGSGSHAKQTAMMLERLEAIMLHEKPIATLVYGDTNSTLAGAIASAKLGIPVIHVEAGNRSFDPFQPEEINRLVADRLSQVLLCVLPSCVTNLAAEGITHGVTHTGDVMFDALLHVRTGRDARSTLSKYNLTRGNYLFVTIHRPESTDNRTALRAIVESLLAYSGSVVFPLHPRTRAALQSAKFLNELENAKHVILTEPLPYGITIDLVANAAVVLTESGGLQKEAYFLGIPCVNPRDRTEWPELVDTGWQTVTNYDLRAINAALANPKRGAFTVQGFGDGHAAEKAAQAIKAFIDSRPPRLEE